MDFAEFLKKAGVFAKDTAIQAGEEFVRNECSAAKAEQRENDIIRAVVTLCDAGIKEAALYELLSKHWGIDSRTEAAAYINKGFFMSLKRQWQKKYGWGVHIISSQKLAFLQYEFYDANGEFIDMKEEIETK